ncbi:hypothetical protein QYM36_005362 [Artemia franciscana]|uniref:C-type lectin domain-containing protein n=1 Tax=Artemia franciscana TaxID=6661 RepID=A0AA88I475_ARTSF|nr:hypothetical protein QYM36_005362 [Artemia franciscana]
MRPLLAVTCLLAVAVGQAAAQRVLALPDPTNCVNRVKHASFADPQGTKHNYFFSWLHRPTSKIEVDWLDARNVCRRHCMDAVSIETLQENEWVKQQMARGGVRYIWTSGRKCDFDGCTRQDLQPLIVNGWFWSGSGARIPPTNQRQLGDWSNTGLEGRPQPDNREEVLPLMLKLLLTL